MIWTLIMLKTFVIAISFHNNSFILIFFYLFAKIVCYFQSILSSSIDVKRLILLLPEQLPWLHFAAVKLSISSFCWNYLRVCQLCLQKYWPYLGFITPTLSTRRIKYSILLTFFTCINLNVGGTFQSTEQKVRNALRIYSDLQDLMDLKTQLPQISRGFKMLLWIFHLNQKLFLNFREKNTFCCCNSEELTQINFNVYSKEIIVILFWYIWRTL